MKHSLLLLCSFVFLISVTSAQGNACSRPVLGDNIKIEDSQRFLSPGFEMVLSCKLGYTPFLGPRTIVCTTSGTWTKTQFTCRPVQCPSPDPPLNGEMHYEDIVYQSTVNFTCAEGYILSGASSAVCLINGTWSAAEPQCKPISCGLAPIPQFGKIKYEKKIRGDTVNYGARGTYECLPPFALFGNERAECTASGTWTETPECREVYCPPPENIENGYMSISEKRDFAYQETIKYGCKGQYILDGSLQIVCQKNGEWSDKPSCKAPCSVGIKRGRILYKGKKRWITDFKPNIVLHKEHVSVYCMNIVRNCGYAVPAQCTDGILQLPECFEEPSAVQYILSNSTLPSEIEQC